MLLFPLINRLVCWNLTFIKRTNNTCASQHFRQRIFWRCFLLGWSLIRTLANYDTCEWGSIGRYMSLGRKIMLENWYAVFPPPKMNGLNIKIIIKKKLNLKDLKLQQMLWKLPLCESCQLCVCGWVSHTAAGFQNKKLWTAIFRDISPHFVILQCILSGCLN